MYPQLVAAPDIMHMHATSLELCTFTQWVHAAMHLPTDSPSNHEHEYCQLHFPKLYMHPQSGLTTPTGLGHCQCTCTYSWTLKLDICTQLTLVPSTTCSSLWKYCWDSNSYCSHHRPLEALASKDHRITPDNWAHEIPHSPGPGDYSWHLSHYTWYHAML